MAIYALQFTYYGWTPTTGGYRRIYTGEARDYDMDLQGALIGTANATLGAEEDGGRAIASDLGITISNGKTAILPTGWGDIIDMPQDGNLIGNIAAGTHGIAAPMLGSAGLERIIAVGLVYAKYNQNAEMVNMPEELDPSLITGDVNSYKEFLEFVERENPVTVGHEAADCIAIMTGYLELSTFQFDRFAESAQVSVVALDKLLRYIPQTALDLPATPTLMEVVNAIIEKAPFVTALDLTALALGSFMWPVKQFEFTFSDDDGLPEGAAFAFDKILQWNLNADNEIQYVEFQDGTNKYIDVAVGLVTPDSSRPARYTHSCDSLTTGLDFTTRSFLPNESAWQPGLLATEGNIGVDLGYTIAPYLPPINSSITTASSSAHRLRSRGFVDMSQILNSSALSGLYYIAYTYYAGIEHWWPASAKWGGSQWQAIGVAGRMLANDDNGQDGIIADGDIFVWREGFKRIFITNESHDKIFSWPAPDTGIRNLNITYRPYDYSRRFNAHFASSGSISSLDNRNFSGSIYRCISAHLGTGDVDAPRYGEGSSHELVYRLYPIYFSNDEVQGVRVHADIVGEHAIGIDSYDGATYNDSVADYYRSRKDILSGGVEGMQPLPDDLPFEPVFIYDIRDRLEIWYYTNEWLHCYDWKMNLKYDFKFGLPDNRVALGRSYDGKLLIALSLTNGLCWLKFESTDTPTWLVVGDETGTAEDILNGLTNQTFAAWWIDRIERQNKMIIRNRYQGINRGKVAVVSHSYESDVNDGQEAPPNREITRRYWDTYADHIDVKDSKERIMATAGVERSIYNYTYNLSNVYHSILGKRIAERLLYILGTRRELLSMPLHAWRGGAYDYLDFYDRPYCVLTARSDFRKTLRTDVDCVNMDIPRQPDNDLLNCALGYFFNYQGGANWDYNSPDVGTIITCGALVCSACDTERIAFMDAVKDLLNELWLPASAALAPGLASDDPDIISEIASIVSDSWDDILIGSDTVSIGSLFNDYLQCVTNNCGWGA